MGFSLIYTKTARGAEEVRTRGAGLSPTARRVLIMVDGKRDENELRLVVRDGELEGVLATLVAQGLIEESGMAERPDATWDDDENLATIPLESSELRFDLGVGAALAQPTVAPAAASSAPPSRAAPPPPPTLRMAIAEVDRRTPPPAPAAPPAPTTIIIKPVRGRSPAVPSAQEDASAALEEAKRTAVRALYERLGPYGEEPAARINDCKSHEALREQIKHACRRISTFRGEPAARDYLASIGMG